MEAVFQVMLGFIKMIRITDIIDIAIIAWLTYKLLWSTRKHSFGRVLKGVVVVLALMAVASVANLYAVSKLFSIVVEYGALALVVVFQPEIRRFLERMGDTQLFHVLFDAPQSNLDSVENAIVQTVEAYRQMSGNKVGALIVFERGNHLDEVIKTGTALDAAVSTELLTNLFWDKAPLHDGAVIVRNGRIVAAGCMLPLSGNANLSRELGMRHRAGIGMSEHTDAIVALVSEENGSISVAESGMLKRHLAPETLDRLLRNGLMAEGEEEKDSEKLLNALLSLFKRSGKEADTDESNH